MRVPLVDLRGQHREVADVIERGWRDVISCGDFISGQAVALFEEEFAAFQGVGHCVGVASGTDALELALRAVGVGPGDEVLVPATTFVATAAAARRAGADIGVVDVEPVSLLMDPDALRARITPRTRAVIPVHLYGQAARMETVVAVAAASGVVVVEDAAQAHGASRNGTPVGGFGTVAAVSFYPGKNLGAYGDAGAVLTDDRGVADRVRSLANHGSRLRHVHEEVGFNSRLDSLQAVVLRAKLERLAAWNQERRAAAARYDALLEGWDEVVRPVVLPGNIHVWHLYVVQVTARDAVLVELHRRGIAAGVHYPTPIHLHRAFADLGLPQGTCPVAEASADRILSLPLFPGITGAQQEAVVEALIGAVCPARTSA